MMSTKAKNGRRIGRWLITALLAGGLAGVAFSLRELSHESLIATFRSFSAGWILCALGVSTFQVTLQLARFYVVFTPFRRPPTFEMLRINLVGQLLNSVTPLRSGDAYKVLRLDAAGCPPSISVVALVGERIADTTALLALALWSSAPVVLRVARGALAGLAGAVLVGVGVAGVALIGAFALIRAFRGHRLVAPVLAVIQRSSRRFLVLLSSPRFVLCCLVSAVTWIADAFTLFSSARAGGAPISLSQAVGCVFLLNIGLAIPLTVANIGVFEASLGYALTLLGVSVVSAVGISTVEHTVKILGLPTCLALLHAGHRAVSAARRKKLPPPARVA